MAITTKQIIYDVHELLNNYSDDNNYSDRHILYLYNLKRGKFLRQLYDNKTTSFDKVCIQTFCLQFEEIDKGLCDLKVGCTILRSTKKLPQLLPVKNRETLISLQPSIALSKPFKLIDISQADYILDRKFSNGIYATIDADNYIYIISNHTEHKLITSLYVSAILSDPSDLEDYVTCYECNDSQPCFTEDTEYPAPTYVIDAARDDIIKLLTATKEQIKEDVRNDSTDN